MTLNKQVVIYIIILFAAIYQDFPLYNYIGEIGRSPIILLTPFMLAYIFSNKNVIVSKYVEAFIKFLLYCFLISTVFIAVTFIHYESLVILDENIILKRWKKELIGAQ